MQIEPIAVQLPLTEDTEPLFTVLVNVAKRNETKPREEWDSVMTQPILMKDGTVHLVSIALPYAAWNEINEIVRKHDASIYVTTEAHRAIFEVEAKPCNAN